MPPGRMTVSTLLGVRYMEIREHFGYHSVSDVPGPLGSQNNVLTDTSNRLLGPQIGARMEYYVEGPWWVNFEIKGAMCENEASESTNFQHIDQNGNPTEYTNQRTHRGTSWIGDLALTAVYRFSPRATAQFGYQALFVDGVALGDVNALQDINLGALSVLGPGQPPPELQHDLSRPVRRTPTGLVAPVDRNRGLPRNQFANRSKDGFCNPSFFFRACSQISPAQAFMPCCSTQVTDATPVYGRDAAAICAERRGRWPGLSNTPLPG